MQAFAFEKRTMRTLGSSLAALELFTRFDTDHHFKISSSAGFISAAAPFTSPRCHLEGLGFKDDRHAVVNLGRELVGCGDHHRAGLEDFARGFVAPLVPQTGDFDPLAHKSFKNSLG